MQIRHLIFVVLIFVASTGAPPTCRANGGAAPVKGRLQKLDIDQGTITLETGPKFNPKTEVFSLASPKIPVLSKKGEKAKLADLQPGLALTLQMSDVNDVEAIVVKAPVRVGLLLAYDARKGTVTIDGGKKGKNKTYAVGKKTPCIFYGYTGTVAQLRPGQRLLMVMSLDCKTVLSLVANMKRGRFDPRGSIVNVDPAEHTVTLLEGRNGKFRFITHPVEKEFLFLFDGQPIGNVKLTDLRVITELKQMHRAAPAWLRMSHDKKKCMPSA